MDKIKVAKKSGCANSQLIHSQSEIPFDLIKDAKTIGISSGASAPEVLVDNFHLSQGDEARHRLHSSSSIIILRATPKIHLILIPASAIFLPFSA